MNTVAKSAVRALTFMVGALLWDAMPAAGQPVSPTPAPTAAADPVERASWRGDVTAAALLEVSNPFGDVRLRFGGPGRTVEVATALQQLDPAGSRLELVVDEKADPATVRVVRTAAAGPPPWPPGWTGAGRTWW